MSFSGMQNLSPNGGQIAQTRTRPTVDLRALAPNDIAPEATSSFDWWPYPAWGESSTPVPAATKGVNPFQLSLFPPSKPQTTSSSLPSSSDDDDGSTSSSPSSAHASSATSSSSLIHLTALPPSSSAPPNHNPNASHGSGTSHTVSPILYLTPIFAIVGMLLGGAVAWWGYNLYARRFGDRSSNPPRGGGESPSRESEAKWFKEVKASRTRSARSAVSSHSSSSRTARPRSLSRSPSPPPKSPPLLDIKSIFTRMLPSTSPSTASPFVDAARAGRAALRDRNERGRPRQSGGTLLEAGRRYEDIPVDKGAEPVHVGIETYRKRGLGKGGRYLLPRDEGEGDSEAEEDDGEKGLLVPPARHGRGRSGADASLGGEEDIPGKLYHCKSDATTTTNSGPTPPPHRATSPSAASAYTNVTSITSPPSQYPSRSNSVSTAFSFYSYRTESSNVHSSHPAQPTQGGKKKKKEYIYDSVRAKDLRRGLAQRVEETRSPGPRAHCTSGLGDDESLLGDDEAGGHGREGEWLSPTPPRGIRRRVSKPTSGPGGAHTRDDSHTIPHHAHVREGDEHRTALLRPSNSYSHPHHNVSRAHPDRHQPARALSTSTRAPSSLGGDGGGGIDGVSMLGDRSRSIGGASTRTHGFMIMEEEGTEPTPAHVQHGQCDGAGNGWSALDEVQEDRKDPAPTRTPHRSASRKAAPSMREQALLRSASLSAPAHAQAQVALPKPPAPVPSTEAPPPTHAHAEGQGGGQVEGEGEDEGKTDSGLPINQSPSVQWTTADSGWWGTLRSAIIRREGDEDSVLFRPLDDSDDEDDAGEGLSETELANVKTPVQVGRGGDKYTALPSPGTRVRTKGSTSQSRDGSPNKPPQPPSKSSTPTKQLRNTHSNPTPPPPSSTAGQNKGRPSLGPMTSPHSSVLPVSPSQITSCKLEESILFTSPSITGVMSMGRLQSGVGSDAVGRGKVLKGPRGADHGHKMSMGMGMTSSPSYPASTVAAAPLASMCSSVSTDFSAGMRSPRPGNKLRSNRGNGREVLIGDEGVVKSPRIGFGGGGEGGLGAVDAGKKMRNPYGGDKLVRRA